MGILTVRLKQASPHGSVNKALFRVSLADEQGGLVVACFPIDRVCLLSKAASGSDGNNDARQNEQKHGDKAARAGRKTQKRVKTSVFEKWARKNGDISAPLSY
jgi:hypothetical protein